jgi:hypothetical protein
MNFLTFQYLSIYASPAFLKLTETSVTPILKIAITKNVVTSPNSDVSVEEKLVLVLAAATWLATVGAKLTPTIITINPQSIFCNIFYLIHNPSYTHVNVIHYFLMLNHFINMVVTLFFNLHQKNHHQYPYHLILLLFYRR